MITLKTYKDHSIADLFDQDRVPLYSALAFEFVRAVIMLRLLCFQPAQTCVYIGAQLLDYLVNGKEEWMSWVKLPSRLLCRTSHDDRDKKYWKNGNQLSYLMVRKND